MFEHLFWKVFMFNPMLCQSVARSGICWQGLLVGFGKVLQTMARCGKVWQGVARSGKVWNDVAKCG